MPGLQAPPWCRSSQMMFHSHIGVSLSRNQFENLKNGKPKQCAFPLMYFLLSHDPLQEGMEMLKRN